MLVRRHAEDAHVETLVPVGVQRLLDDARGPRLLAADGGDRKGIREACRTCERSAEAERWVVGDDVRKTSRL
jgi:hypothetical protein